MATSGNSNFNQTKVQLITDSLRLIGRLGEGETPTTNAIDFASNILNKMMKHWETQGVHLWTASYGTIFMNANQRVYTMNDGTDHACDDETLTETTLSANASGTSIIVNEIGSTAIGYIVGVLLDTGTRHWTTVTNVVGNTITLDDALPSGASANNTVFTYEEEIGRILRVTDSTLRFSSNNDLNMAIMGRVQYNRIVSKNIAGNPNQVSYQPMLNTGKFYVWPVPSSSDMRLKISYIQSIQDMDLDSDNPDFPQEWLHALTYNLARALAAAYGLDLVRKELSDIIAIAQTSLEELKAWDSDNGSVFIRPADDNYPFY